jgi:hypothetical protein
MRFRLPVRVDAVEKGLDSLVVLLDAAVDGHRDAMAS